mmetsp:Transcript_606/g.2227  ORF Transcript_606/g.2227 Transcript_606/m.2227 type:complete len:647 (+) Transcript_606:4930-6870(+)
MRDGACQRRRRDDPKFFRLAFVLLQQLDGLLKSISVRRAGFVDAELLLLNVVEDSLRAVDKLDRFVDLLGALLEIDVVVGALTERLKLHDGLREGALQRRAREVGGVCRLALHGRPVGMHDQHVAATGDRLVSGLHRIDEILNVKLLVDAVDAVPNTAEARAAFVDEGQELRALLRLLVALLLGGEDGLLEDRVALEGDVEGGTEGVGAAHGESLRVAHGGDRLVHRLPHLGLVLHAVSLCETDVVAEELDGPLQLVRQNVFLAAEPPLLDADDERQDQGVAHGLQRQEHVGPQEQLGRAEPVVVRGDAVRNRVAGHHPMRLLAPGELGVDLHEGGEDLELPHKLLIRNARGEAAPADGQRGHHSRAHELAENAGAVHDLRAEVVVRLDAAHEADVRRLQRLRELRKLGQVVTRNSGAPRPVVLDGRVREEGLHDVARGGRAHAGQVREERIEVLLHESINAVDDRPGVVLDHEVRRVGPRPVAVLPLRARAADAVERVSHVGLVPLRDEVLVAGRRSAAALALHERDEAHGLLLDQLDAEVVVGELGLVPLDLLALVLLRFLLEDGEVEELLQLLVGEVDEQLLEAVGRHLLEAEDIKDADEVLRLRAGDVERGVDAAHQPVEEGAVDRLAQRIAAGGALRGRLR